MKIPVEIQRIRDPDGVSRFKAIVSLEDAIMNSSLNKKLIQIQKEYSDFIENCKIKLEGINRTRKNRGNALLKWQLANIIYKFLKSLEMQGFILVNVTEALSRDLKISRRQINYLIEFRVTYPHITLIKREISWDKYKELLDIPNPSLRKICEQKILKGELRTRDDIRRFKKEMKQTRFAKTDIA